MGFWRITQKDLILLRRDRRALAMLLVMPLIFIAILGMSTGQMLGWRNKNELISIVVVNADNGSLSQQLVDNLKNSNGISVRESTDRAAAKKMVNDGDCTAAVVIDSGFEKNVKELKPVEVMKYEHGQLAAGLDELGVHVDSGDAASNAQAVVDQLVNGQTLRTIIAPVLRRNAFINLFFERNIDESRQTADKETTSTAKKPRSGVDYGSFVYQKLVPAYTVMFTFFLVTIMARSFLAERELGTLSRLRTTPIGVGSLLLGKTLPFYFVSVAQGVLLFLGGRLLFGMSWGNHPPMLIPIILCTSMAATGLGLLISTIVRTDAQVTSFGTVVIITMAGISGCFMPRDWMPEMMRNVSLATPHAWALIAYDQILGRPHANLHSVWQSCGVLCLFSAAFFGLGCLRFRLSA